MLEKFRAVKQKEILRLMKMAQNGSFPKPMPIQRASFSNALGDASPGAPLAVIAEYKRASPSKGNICETLSVEDVVTQYNKGGAKAVSILTETHWFKGSFEFLAKAGSATDNSLPLLRKDFILDPIQIDETASSPASAILLITRFTPDARVLRQLREHAEVLGIESVVEIFDEDDLMLARDSGARIIQVNARDLSTFKVDRNSCMELIKKYKPEKGEIWIAASGMENREQLLEAAGAGYKAALVGTALMAGGQPGKALCRLLGGEPDAA